MAWEGVELRLYDYTNVSHFYTFDPEVDGCDDVRWQKVRHELGSGSFTLPVGARTAEDVPIEVERGQVIRVYLDGEPYFAWRVERIQTRQVLAGKDAGRRIAISGRGLLLDFQRAIVTRDVDLDLLPKGDGNRYFSPYAPGYDDSSWTTVTELAESGLDSPFYAGYPEGWPDAPANWCWNEDGTLTDAPPGFVLFRFELNFENDYEDVELLYSVDNFGVPFWNGEPIDTEGWRDFRQHKRLTLGTVTAGTHMLAFLGENGPDEGPPGENPGALLWTVLGGPDKEVLVRSGTVGTTGAGGEVTRARVLGYPDPWPGQTAGEMVLQLMADMGLLSDWVCSFDEALDSNGDAFVVLPQTPARIGDDLVSVLRSLSDLWVTFDVDPEARTLHLYNKGATPPTAPLTLIPAWSTAGQADPSAVNVNELTWDDVDDGYDNVLTPWEKGYVARPDPVNGNGRWEYVSAGSADTEEAAAQIADAYLEAFGEGTSTATVKLTRLPTADWPGGDWDVGHLMAVPQAVNLDATTDQEIKSVSGEVNAQGVAEFTVELGSLVVSRRELLSRNVARMGELGGLGGQASAATPAIRFRESRTSPGVQVVTVGYFDDPFLRDSGKFPFPFLSRLAWLKLTGDNAAAAADTTVDVYVNTDLVATLTMGSGVEETFATIGDIVGRAGIDNFTLDITALGGHDRLSITAGLTAITA